MKGYEVFPRGRNPEMASKTPASQVLALHEPLTLTWAGPETGWAVAPWLWCVPWQETLKRCSDVYKLAVHSPFKSGVEG